jgi:CHAT domain-containing protein
VFLEACQTAQSDADPNASMAGALLEAGVSSVIAMSHSVMVETARRFVEAFYQQIAKGQSVGTAMLAGRKNLLENTERFNIIGAGMLHLQDWFVPCLYPS